MRDIKELRSMIDRADQKLGECFEERMSAVREVAEYKIKNGISILDKAREEEVIEKNCARLSDQTLRPYYLDFLKSTMRISRSIQSDIMKKSLPECAHLDVTVKDTAYPIDIGSGIIAKANEYFDLARKVLVITDSGVPREYSEAIAHLCRDARIFTFPEGESSKSIATLEAILNEMTDFGMQRCDAAVAVGGGVTGDITALASSLYMRGIDFYSVPTTILAAVDSSIGGKCALNLGGIKNVIGTFYHPRAVLIDTDTFKTLDERQTASGIAEVVKMAATSDAELFSLLEGGLAKDDIKKLVYRALIIKKRVVEEDEKESGPRRILNFGHTLGHGIEALGGKMHGECVALGMIPMSGAGARDRIVRLLSSLGLPTEADYDIDKALDFIKYDKKGEGKDTYAIFVDTIGDARIEKVSQEFLTAHIKANV